MIKLPANREATLSSNTSARKICTKLTDELTVKELMDEEFWSMLNGAGHPRVGYLGDWEVVSGVGRTSQRNRTSD